MLALVTFGFLMTGVNARPSFSGYTTPHLTFVSNGAKRTLSSYVLSAAPHPGGLLAVITTNEELRVYRGPMLLHEAKVQIGSEVIGWWKSWAVVRNLNTVIGYEWRGSRVAKHELPIDLVQSVTTDTGMVLLKHGNFYGLYLMQADKERTEAPKGGKGEVFEENEGDGGYVVQAINQKGALHNAPIGVPGAEVKLTALGGRYVAVMLRSDGKSRCFICDTGDPRVGTVREANWRAASMCPGPDKFHAIAATGINPYDLGVPISSTMLWSVDLKTLDRKEIGTAPGWLSPCGLTTDHKWLISIRNQPSGSGHSASATNHSLVATNLQSMKTVSFGPALSFYPTR